MVSLARITEKLDLKEFQLRSLLEVTKAINDNETVEQLLGLFQEIVHDQLGITRLILHTRVSEWQRVLALGVDPEDTHLDVEAAIKDITDIQMLGSNDLGGNSAFDVAIPVHHREMPIALLLIGDLDEKGAGMSPTVKHLNYIQTLTNVIVVAMENRRLAEQALEQERYERELALAAEIQGMLFPQTLPEHGQLEMASWYQPHREVGGDYYDLIELPGGEVVFCVADVSGKGIPAALLMSNFQATLHALVRYDHGALDALVHQLNEKVFKNARGERFITMFLGRFDPATRMLTYVNAGHNPSILLDGNSSTELSMGTVGLGMLEALPFIKTGAIKIPKDAVMLCYTDGLAEQENNTGDAFGTERIITCMQEQGSMPELVGRIARTLEAHRGTSPYFDDIAILACRFR